MLAADRLFADEWSNERRELVVLADGVFSPVRAMRIEVLR
jgi:hypothetical protein